MSIMHQVYKKHLSDGQKTIINFIYNSELLLVFDTVTSFTIVSFNISAIIHLLSFVQ